MSMTNLTFSLRNHFLLINSLKLELSLEFSIISCCMLLWNLSHNFSTSVLKLCSSRKWMTSSSVISFVSVSSAIASMRWDDILRETWLKSLQSTSTLLFIFLVIEISIIGVSHIASIYSKRSYAFNNWALKTNLFSIIGFMNFFKIFMNAIKDMISSVINIVKELC